MNLRAFALFVALTLGLLPSIDGVEQAGESKLATVAEKSNFTATSKHTEVREFCEKLAKMSPLVRLAELGETNEKRKLPLVIVADPPIATPEEAAKSRKLVVFALGNIHAGEVDGKEALMMLMRDLALAKDHPLLKELILVFAPNFNADGGDRFGKNRPGQAGPDQVGIRQNAQNFDLNRDFIKLESPECQALARFFRHWDPAVVIDCHTTDGFYHPYTLTFDAPRHPAVKQVGNYVRDVMLPEVSKRMEKSSGYKSFWYGAGNPKNGRWDTTEAYPRFGFHYLGFRNRLGILSESYDYAPFRDRVLASKAFVLTCFEYAAENAARIRSLCTEADKANTDAPAGAPVALRHKRVPLGGKTPAQVFEGGKTAETGGKIKDLQVDLMFQTEATLSVNRPFAYLLPAAPAKIVEKLQQHGIDVEELREDIDLDVEAYQITKVDTAAKIQAGYGMHYLVSVEAKANKEARKIKAGTIVVRTNQKLGTLAAFLLEPQSEDGLVAWNYFDPLKQGQEFAVLRLPAKAPILLAKIRPLPEDMPPKKQLTLDMLDKGTMPNFNGNPTVVSWLPDGEHFMQIKDKQVWKVHAVTGRSEVYTRSSPSMPSNADVMQQLIIGSVALTTQDAPPASHGALVPDLGTLAALQKKGKGAAPGGRELQSTGPGGKYVAFVRNNNLYVEEVATKTERALTNDGSEVIRNGKTDWVYYEEVYDRKAGYKHYWWSPDGNYIAFVQLDDSPVPKAAVIDYTKPKQLVEMTHYPRVGEPNPLVKLAIAPVAGGEVRWVNLEDYAQDASFLITRVGWLPDSKAIYFCAQDRCQTWLDFCIVGVEGGRSAKVLRDTTKAWVEPPLPPVFLQDDTVLLTSERTGWRHIYRYAKDGTLKGQLTSGDWDVNSVQRVDEKEGYVFFSGTKDNALANNTYKAKLDGTGLEKLTKGKGDNQVAFSPRGDMFVNTTSAFDTQPQVSLHRTDGTLIRVLDSNPVFVEDYYQKGGYQRVQIPTPDGFMLEASVQKPANFDPAKKYPVWYMTYGGPRAPELKGGGGKKGGGDQALANSGYIVFRADPRSASNKGAVSAWACYKQLGYSELKDVETAIQWLTAHPWVDADRVGMSGSSYGGYLTAYCLCNSKLFAAGVASAPPTDWRNYDSIYTERYMLTPKENLPGYDLTSVVKTAKNIHGRLLLAHGLKDDNVHVQNTFQLVDALQKAGKEFDVMIYPLARHGGFGGTFTQLQREFMKKHLKPEP